MRLSGRISNWNDGKGFGFVAPTDGGDRTFVHIKQFQRGSRRPVDGDLITYLPAKDSRGRLQARKIRHAGIGAERRRSFSRFPRAAAGFAALAVVAVAAALEFVPIHLAGAYVGLSVFAYAMYWLDKAAAQAGGRRTPETTLHLVSMLGGWPGALVAQQQFRHKTIKQPFQILFWATVVINLLAVGWLIMSGAAWAGLQRG